MIVAAARAPLALPRCRTQTPARLSLAQVLPLPVLTRSSLVSSLTGGLDPRTSADLLRAAMALGSGAQRVRWVGASADSAAGAEEPQRRLPQIADLLSKKKKAGREQGEPPERSQSGAGPAASSVGLVRGGPFVEGMVALTEHSGMDGQRWGEIFQRLGRDDPQVIGERGEAGPCPGGHWW